MGRKVVQQLQHDGAEAWCQRRFPLTIGPVDESCDCEVVKETKTRYVCRLLSDGLLPRVRCLRSLISANTPASVPAEFRPVATAPIFPFLAC